MLKSKETILINKKEFFILEINLIFTSLNLKPKALWDNLIFFDIKLDDVVHIKEKKNILFFDKKTKHYYLVYDYTQEDDFYIPKKIGNDNDSKTYVLIVDFVCNNFIDVTRKITSIQRKDKINNFLNL